MTLSEPEVIRFLNHEAVPHWESVGPVPKITIDFGNGHHIERTLGGNIVMMLALPDGRVVDAYPGVYTPKDLVSELQQSMRLLRELGMNAPDRAYLDWHRQKVGNHSAAATTLSKAVVESPILSALGKKPTVSTDLSKHPISADKLGELLGNNGPDIVEADSRNNVAVVRPAVHRWFAERKSLPRPEECKKAMYEDLLHMPLDDPYLGLAEFAIPGTER